MNLITSNEVIQNKLIWITLNKTAVKFLSSKIMQNANNSASNCVEVGAVVF